MDYKDDKFNLKYFKGKDWPITVGAGLAFIGIIPFVLAILNLVGFYFVVIGIVIAGIGAVLLLPALGGRTNEAGFEEQIERNTKPMREVLLKKMNLEEKHVKVIALHDPHMFGNYDFTGKEDILLKKGNDGKIRSSIYSSTMLMYTKDTLICYNYRFSFIDSLYKTEEIKTFKYVNIEKAFITNGEYEYNIKETKNTVKYSCFNVKDFDGNIFTSIAKNDADLDKLVEDITLLADKYRKQAADKPPVSN